MARIFHSAITAGFFNVCVLITSLAGKNHLSHADALWCHFDEFVVVDPFESAFQSELAAWRQLDGIIGAGCTGVGQMFLLARVDVHVLVAGIFADDHAFINFYARFKEEFASVENGVQAVSGRRAGFGMRRGNLCSFRISPLYGA